MIYSLRKLDLSLWNLHQHQFATTDNRLCGVILARQKEKRTVDVDETASVRMAVDYHVSVTNWLYL